MVWEVGIDDRDILFEAEGGGTGAAFGERAERALANDALMLVLEVIAGRTVVFALAIDALDPALGFVRPELSGVEVPTVEDRCVECDSRVEVSEGAPFGLVDMLRRQ